MKINVGDRVVLEGCLSGYVKDTILNLNMRDGTYTKELHILTDTGVLLERISYSQVESINHEDVKSK